MRWRDRVRDALATNRRLRRDLDELSAENTVLFDSWVAASEEAHRLKRRLRDVLLITDAPWLDSDDA
jgi:hypothetical protein